MLEEVGQTVLVRSLLDGADVGCEIELGTLLGLVVVTYVVSESVVKLALTDCRVVRKLLELLRAGERKCGDEQCSDKEKSLHYQFDL